MLLTDLTGFQAIPPFAHQARDSRCRSLHTGEPSHICRLLLSSPAQAGLPPAIIRPGVLQRDELRDGRRTSDGAKEAVGMFLVPLPSSEEVLHLTDIKSG